MFGPGFPLKRTGAIIALPLHFARLASSAADKRRATRTATALAVGRVPGKRGRPPKLSSVVASPITAAESVDSAPSAAADLVNVTAASTPLLTAPTRDNPVVDAATGMQLLEIIYPRGNTTAGAATATDQDAVVALADDEAAFGDAVKPVGRKAPRKAAPSRGRLANRPITAVPVPVAAKAAPSDKDVAPEEDEEDEGIENICMKNHISCSVSSRPYFHHFLNFTAVFV